MPSRAMGRIVLGALIFMGVAIQFQSVDAQAGPGAFLAIQGYYPQLQFYLVDSAGGYEPLAELTAAYQVMTEAGWRTLGVDQFILSPDGRRVAFSAYRQQAGSQESAMFVYSLGQDGLREFSVPGLGEPRWSPASDAIAMGPWDAMTGMSMLRHIYLYDLAADTFGLLTDLPDGFVRGGVIWLSDNEHVIFLGPSVRCTLNCGYSIFDLYAIDRGGENPVRLTDLDAQLPVQPETGAPLYGICYPTRLTWSTAASRLYYAVSCDEAEDELLFSVSLDGDNRLEADLPALYPDDETTTVRAIFPDAVGDGALVVVHARNPQSNDSVLDWRILRVGPPGEVVPVFAVSRPFRYWLTDAMLSPDARLIAVSGEDVSTDGLGNVLIVDLDAGRVILNSEMPRPVCDVKWADDGVLLYIEGQMDGFCMLPPSPGRVWSLDIETNSAQDITPDLGLSVWVIFSPEVVPLAD